jgi:hypothetical protein
MTDLRKAAELALDALEILSKNELPKKGAVKAELDEVLIPILRQALAESEQKPLVWMNKYGHVASFQNEEYKDPLYTAPPKREWVGLTDEEIKSICNEWKIMYGGYVDNFAKFIEAKLKEKNI